MEFDIDFILLLNCLLYIYFIFLL